MSAATLFALAAFGSVDAVIDPGDGGNYQPSIDPSSFTTRIDNPYLPYLPGARWIYEGETEDGEVERVEVTVTDDRRMVGGVETMVHDVVSVDGEVIDDTFDWYAQNDQGNVWYLGEDSTSYDLQRNSSKAGSWEAGVDGALPGIVMLAAPAVDLAYREEYYRGEAEDMAEVVALDDRPRSGSSMPSW